MNLIVDLLLIVLMIFFLFCFVKKKIYFIEIIIMKINECYFCIVRSDIIVRIVFFVDIVIGCNGNWVVIYFKIYLVDDYKGVFDLNFDFDKVI